jgi:hypothetical protein
MILPSRLVAVRNWNMALKKRLPLPYSGACWVFWTLTLVWEVLLLMQRGCPEDRPSRLVMLSALWMTGLVTLWVSHVEIIRSGNLSTGRGVARVLASGLYNLSGLVMAVWLLVVPAAALMPQY